MTIILDIAPGAPICDAELAAREHDAASVAQGWNAGVAACQRELRDVADKFDRTFPGAALPMQLAAAYRSAADHLGALRT